MKSKWQFGLMDAPNIEARTSSYHVFGALHSVTLGTMMSMYKLLDKYHVMDGVDASRPLKALELGCGRPFLATFLSLIGFDVNAIDLPSGMKCNVCVTYCMYIRVVHDL